MQPLLAATFLAQTAAPGGASMISGLLPFVFIIGAMYFLILAPQRKKQKADEKMRAELQTGDEIMTNGGIFGTITNVKDDRFVIRVADNTKLEVAKAFVQSRVKPANADKK
ncbi:MAG TPA: preprotein translocase subunit YajC [Opitutaceae bacterium]|nr:preprotein translocase subunit YajC [Opitutaceae bacterium]